MTIINANISQFLRSLAHSTDKLISNWRGEIYASERLLGKAYRPNPLTQESKMSMMEIKSFYIFNSKFVWGRSCNFCSIIGEGGIHWLGE